MRPGCRTLLPAKARLTDNSGEGKEFLHLTARGKRRTLKYSKFLPPKARPEWRLGRGRVDVEPAGAAAECVYLHVLYPTDTGTAGMPACSVTRKGADLVVKVGKLSHTFRAVK